jgi:hypothetical protein
MEDDKDDDFICIRIGGGKTIATHKGVTVVASKRNEQKESQNNKLLVKPLPWWRRPLKSKT